MTTQTSSHPASSHATAAAAADPRPLFSRAVALAVDSVAAVRPDQLDGRTPCTDFDVRQLMSHLIGVLHRVAAAGRGEDVFTVSLEVTGVPDDGWATALAQAAGEAQTAWADDAALSRTMRLPFGTLPGAAALASYVGEVTTHTWDLAAATGQSPEWDTEILGTALTAIRSKLPQPERGPGIPFGTAVPVPADAPLVDQLVAWQGRDPGWTTPA
jgi:uncharacterized protein (TIGR03086 family)